jgi:DNA-directed RNA polymerase specialized sigma24 family protein
VHAPTATIEDACQTAWSTLLGRPDIDLDQRGLNWLTTVATREAWRQGSTARELPAGAFIAADLAAEAGELPSRQGQPAIPPTALARDEHNQRVRHLLALKPREREALYLQGLGHSYHAIAALTDSTYTAVNRRITEGRARLHQLDTEPGG